MRIHAIRLVEGQDLRREIIRYVTSHGLTSAFVMTCVGSLNPTVLRMAGAQPERQVVRSWAEDVEIVSLVGTIAQSGQAHLHMSVSTFEGLVVGGHLKDGSMVHTTAEIVLGEDEATIYRRELDEKTGFDELKVDAK